MLIKFENVTKIYGSSTDKAINDFSTEILAGEIVGLIGKNGSGKTTLLNCLVDNIHLTTGNIFYNGQNLMEHKELISQFGVLIESSFLDYLNAKENLQLLMMAEGITHKKQYTEAIERVLNIVGLKDRENDYVKNFSFGMKQRLGLAQALLRDRKVLILDEPLVGLDVLGRELVKTIIKDLAKNKGTAIIFSDHNLNEVKDICDRIIYIEEGKKLFDDVFDDSKTYVITIDSHNNEMISKYFELENGRIVIRDSLNSHESIENILSHNAIIKDIEIQQQSLIQFFKGD